MSENFILKDLLDYLNPMSENFILKVAFVPDEDFLAEKFDSLKSSFESKLGVNPDEISQFQNVTPTSITGISELEGSVYGKRVKFVDFTFIDSYLNRFHNLARGFMFPLIVFYNLNQIYFLVRGVNLWGNGKDQGGKI